MAGKRRAGRSGWLSGSLLLLALGTAEVASAADEWVPEARSLAPGAFQVAAADVPIPRSHPRRTGAAPPRAGNDLIGDLIAGAGVVLSLAEEPSTARELPIVSALVGGDLGFKSALELIEAGDIDAATRVAWSMPDRADTLLVEWLIGTSGKEEVSSARVATAANYLTGWPGHGLMRIRFEQALAREKPAPDAVIRALGGAERPASEGGVLLLARAYVAAGQKNDASTLIRSYWRTADFSESIESAIADEFGSLLTAADHRARMSRLFYEGDNTAAMRVAKRLGPAMRKLAEAWSAVNRKTRKAGDLLEAVPSEARSEAGYQFARVRYLRNAERYGDAAKILLEAPTDPKVLIDPEAWARERRTISRELLDQGKASLAYRVAAGHSAQERVERVEIEFQAGWIALRQLNDPKAAARHFAEIGTSSTMPLSQSRSAYWLGRAAEAARDTRSAADYFRRAAAYPTTFYGQLALARLQGSSLTISEPPQADRAARDRYAARELVRAMNRLAAMDRKDQAAIFARHLAETLDDPTEIALLAQQAEARGDHQLALQIGKTAQVRGLPVDTLAFPTAAIPASADMSYVETPVVFAIARQESAFNPAAVSRAGARGLLQLMPGTARETARSIGLTYSESRLTRDPSYNATLGAAHLGALFRQYDGSFVMAFAAYNAGPRRVKEWVAAYGDPRDPKVDVIDWIERIPIAETRNYVQRTIENLQVYRARLGQSRLTIEADLRRGGAG